MSTKGTQEHDLWLGRRALSRGLISGPQLTEALLLQSKTGLRKTLDQVLVERGWAEAEALETLRAGLVGQTTQRHAVTGDAPDPRLGQIIQKVLCDKVLRTERHLTSYLGRLPRDPVPVVLHLIPKAGLRDGLWLDFLETVRACLPLRSPNLTEVLSVDSIEDTFGILCRHAKGAIELDTLLERVRRLKLSEALRVVGEIAAGLRDLHAANLIHRDLQPGRVILEGDGSVRLTLAGVVSRPEDAPSGALGSPHWMSPEACKGRTPDARSDIYSLGVLAYELVTGVRPFEGETFADLAAQHEAGEVIAPHRVMTALPADVGDLLTWMLAKSPKERPDAAQVAAAIKEVGQGIQRTGLTQKFQAFNPDE